MKYLCVLFPLSILISAVCAAPTKSENQKSVKLQGWGSFARHMLPIAVDVLRNHGSEKSFQEKAAVEVQGVDRYLDAIRGTLDGYLNHDGAAEMQKMPWGEMVKTFGPIFAEHILHSHGTAESFKDDVAAEVESANRYLHALQGALGAYLNHDAAVEAQGLPWNTILTTVGPMIHDYINHHQSLLEKLEKVALEQDGDIMAAIESLPEKEKAQAQIIGTLSALLTAGSLARDLING